MNEIFLSQLKIDESTVVYFYRSPFLCHSPAYPFFLKSTSIMIEQGLILPISDWTDNRCGLIYGKVQGKVISFILYDLDYDLQKRNQTLLISKTFVDQKYRQKKIYSNMQTLLINYSRDLGYMNIATIVNKNNIGYIECIEKLGLAFICYKTWKEIS